MKKYFEEHETLFSILLIIVYVILNSYFKTTISKLIINTIFSGLLIFLIIKLDRVKYYGLVKVNNYKKFLYFIPLILLSTVYLWNGIKMEYSLYDFIINILVMINVGFIEEIVFRGFLFKMMAKDNMKSAIIVSSLTFGIGHIVNLLNGAEFISTLIQIVCAISIGYLFVTIFIKSKSLIPCIITHIVLNSTSIFNDGSNIIIPIVILIISITYTIYINKNIKE